MSPVANESISVRCRGLIKTYGAGPTRVRALRGVDLEVRHGEMLMLIGPSGCGKTTLVSILSGIFDQDEGECEILGRDFRRLEERERVRFRGRSIGFVFQIPNLFPALTAAENVAIPLLLAGKTRKDSLARAGHLMELVDLADRKDSLPGMLSGGQQQRVAIARAVVHDPMLVVCDEPTSNLDQRSGHSVMAVLRDLTSRPGRSLIVVTHDPRILEFADRVAQMEDGRIVDLRPETGGIQF